MKTFTSKTKIKYLALFLLLTPLSLYAATATAGTVFGGLGNMINSFNGSVVKATGTLFLTLAVVVFFYGIVIFIWNKKEGKAEGVKSGQSFMAWGLLALFVMFSVWGIVSFFGRSLGIETGGTINIPSLDFKLNGTTGTNNNSSRSIEPSSGTPNYEGCNSIGQTCRSGSITGTCKQNTETGELYCS